MKLKHLFISNRLLTKPNRNSPFIYQNAISSSSSSSTTTPQSHFLTPQTPNFRHPISSQTPFSSFRRNVHSAIIATPVKAEPDHDESEEEEEDGAVNAFLSRFVWIMRGKLAHVYPDCDKQSINGMLLIIVDKVVEELEKGGIEEMLRSASITPTHDFSEDLWKTVWEVSTSVLDEMKRAMKKEEMKMYSQCEQVKEMCRFASEVGIRGNMLREFRFKWAKEKMEEDEIYGGINRMRQEAREQEKQEEMNEGDDMSEVVGKEEEMNEGDDMSEVVGEGSDVGVRMEPRVASLPQRRGKIKYKIYGLDLSGPKWAEVADKIHESEKLIWPEEPKPITGKCKLVTEQILNSTEGDDLSKILAEWVELLEPSRVDWFALLDRLTERNVGLYLKVAELILDEVSFQANIRDYSKLIDAHANDNHMDDSERILKKMNEKGIQPDIITSIMLVHMYSKAGNLDRAKETFEWLRNQGFQPDMKVYTAMINAYLNAGQPKYSETLMREMEARDMRATDEMYMALLRSFSERGQVDGAHRISTTMNFFGIMPTLESCTLLVEAYAQAGDAVKAKGHFDYMRKFGHKPDDRCAASLISVYEKKNYLDQALDLLLELEAEGFEPGVATYTVLVDWLGKLQLIDEAEELLRKITAKGDSPPFKIQVSLCDMYSRSRDEKKALQALGILEGKKDLLGLDDFERIIIGLIEGGLVQDAIRVREMMETRGFSASEPLTRKFKESQAFHGQRPIPRW